MKYFFLLTIFIGLKATAQNFVWMDYADISYSANGISVCSDHENNVYVGGNYNNENNYSSDSNGCFIRKYNPSGTLIWNINGNRIFLSDLVLDDQDNLLVTGTYQQNSLLDGIGPGDLSSGGFFAKINNLGGVLWFKSFHNGNNIPKAIATDQSGNVYVTGVFLDSLSLCEINLITNQGSDFWNFIAKFDSNGNCIWVKNGQGAARVKSLHVDKFGTAHIAGEFSGLLEIDGIAINCLGSVNGYIAKFNSVGELQWLNNIGPSGQAVGEVVIGKISVDGNSNVYLSGSYDHDLTLGNVYLTNNGTYFPKPFIAKFNSNGMCVSAEQNNCEISILKNRTYKSGIINSQITYSNLPLHEGFYIMECDSAGDGIWAYQPTGLVRGNFNTDNNNNLLVTGSFTETVDFGGGAVTGDNDMFVVKIYPISIGIEKENANDLYQIYPNPTTGTLNLVYHPINITKSYQISIKNILGQTVYSLNNTTSQIEYKTIIDLSKENKGIYFVEVIADGERSVKKVVLQ